MRRNVLAQPGYFMLYIYFLQHSYTVTAGVAECKACINTSECVYCNAPFYNQKPDYCLCNQNEVCEVDFDPLETIDGCKMEPIPPDVMQIILIVCCPLVCAIPSWLLTSCANMKAAERIEFEMTYLPEPQTSAQDKGSTTSNEKQYQDVARITGRGWASETGSLAVS